MKNKRGFKRLLALSIGIIGLFALIQFNVIRDEYSMVHYIALISLFMGDLVFITSMLYLIATDIIRKKYE